MLKSDFRLISLRVLDDVLQKKMRLDTALDARSGDFDREHDDMPKVNELTRGVLREKKLIDYSISLYTQKLPKDETLINILRIGFYQLTMMDSIPEYAAINSTVELAKAAGLQGKSGFVNGVLRSILQGTRKNVEIRMEDRVAGMSVRYSYPEWMIRLFQRDYGPDKIARILSSGNEKPPLFLRANTVKTSRQSLLDMLNETKKVNAVPGAIDECIEVRTGDPFETKACQSGLFYAQDISSQIFASLVNAKADQTIIDIGSAPGGKAAYYAMDMGNAGVIYAVEPDAVRHKTMVENFKRLGITCIKPELLDAAADRQEFYGLADIVSVDAPCSALGIIRRHPEKKWILSEEEMKKYPVLQLKILNNVKKWVRAGGELFYSTCTINATENEAVIEAFLSENEDFRQENIFTGRELPDEFKTGNYFISLPGNEYNADGFFAAKLVRR